MEWRSWMMYILTGIEGGHEQREPRQLILHRCFHVPQSASNCVYCPTATRESSSPGIFSLTRYEWNTESRKRTKKNSCLSFGGKNLSCTHTGERASEKGKVESSVALFNWLTCCCFFVLSPLFFFLLACLHSTRFTERTHRATDRVPLTRTTTARMPAEFRRR